MAKKRANGEGNIRKRADGRWEGRYTAGYHPETGKRIIKNVLGKTQAECKAKLSAAMEAARGIDVSRADEYTVAIWLRSWYEIYAKPNIRISTANRYQLMVEQYTIPRIGSIKLTKLTAHDLQKLYKDLMENGRIDRKSGHGNPGLSSTTVRSLHLMLHNAFERAVKERLIPRNPTEDCIAPKVQKIEMQILSPEHIKDYFEIKDGKRVTLQVTNKKLSGIVIHKIDSATGEGIYGVKFVLYDANKKPIGEYTSDDEGYIYIDEIPGGLSGRFYLRELEAAPGYTLDKQYKTVYVSPGKTVEIEWENTAVTGQIQIYKYAAEYNEVTGTAAGTPLKGAVYEIVNARSGKVVDYITTDARGVAASKALPLTRYQIREVTAPAYWQLDPTVHDVTLEYPGQIIKLSAYDKPASLGVTITKRGNAQVMAGQSMRYDLTVANTSNVPLESFFWHDKIPYDVSRPTTLTTGTYSARLNYRVLYKTNYNTSYQVLASNLLTSNNYSFSLNAIPMQAGEVVTDIYFDFGKVPVGFQSVVNPTLSVMVNGNAVNGYQMVNRADVGGKYQGTWQTATASWVTIIRRLWNTPTLPKTGY